MHPHPRSNPVVWLLGAMVAALIALVIMLMFRSVPTPPGTPGPQGPEVVTRPGQEVVIEAPKKAPKPIDQERITATLQAGRTYEMLLKGEVLAKGTDTAWGTSVIAFVQYLSECAVDRTIEKNDGNTIVEVRHYKVVRNVQVDRKVEEVSWDFGAPGDLALTCLESVLPGTTTVLGTVQPFAKKFVKSSYEWQLDEQAKVRGMVDSLSGKKVRLTFENGKGVTRIQPIDCDLTSSERDYIAATAVVADCFILPDAKLKPGASWAIDGQNLSGLIDPTLRGDTSGMVTVVRRDDTKRGMHLAAVLEISDGRVVIDSTTPEKYDIGTFTPHGKLYFDLEDQFVESAELTGYVSIERRSRDHFLFETSFKTKPEIAITYTCKIR
jgi:hypothetical protein